MFWGAVIGGIRKWRAEERSRQLWEEEESRLRQSFGRAQEDEVLGSDRNREADVVKVRCRNCQSLNDEVSKFCGQCGDPI